MSRINLLPWREEMRKQKTSDYYTLMGMLIGLVITIIFAVWLHIGGLINYQYNTRNQFLQKEIDILDTKLKEIQELESTKKNLLARMDVIQQLQTSRPLVVHLFDDLVYTIPDGIWLTAIQQNSTMLIIEGKAESNARVAAYMRNVTASKWMKNPLLELIKAEKNERNAIFKLSLNQDAPQGLKDEEE